MDYFWSLCRKLYVTVTGADLAGNTYAGSDKITITLDSTAPTVTLSDTDDDNFLAASDTVTITAFFNEAMTATPTISISGTSVSGEIMQSYGSGSVITPGLLMHFPFDGNTNEITNSTSVIEVGILNMGRTGMEELIKRIISGNNTSYISGNMPELLNNDYTYSVWIKPDQPGRVGKEWVFAFGENTTAQHLGIAGGNLSFGTWGNNGFSAGNSFLVEGGYTY